MNIAIIGEAWGEHEERQRKPFVGPSGFELTRMLADAGIHRADCFLTNVFNLRPKGNKIEALCGSKAEGLPGYPALTKGKYIRAEFADEIKKLGEDLCRVNPNIVVAMGNTPMWALSGKTAIGKLRGSTFMSDHCVRDFKVLPTYHPAAVLRQWNLRPITVMDLRKAAREAAFPEIIRQKREVWIEPTLEDIHEFTEKYIRACRILSVDIETYGRRVTCIGLAPSPFRAIVIPFEDPKGVGGNYWPTEQGERDVWRYLKKLLEDPAVPKLFHNGLFDIAFLYRSYGVQVRGHREDTMLLHHSLQPESLKSLGFLGSIYCDEGAWKELRARSLKRDDE